MHKTLTSIAAALLLTLGTGVHAQNLITNGDFETPAVATDSFNTYTNLGGYAGTTWGSDTTSGTHKIIDVADNQFMQFGAGDTAYAGFGVSTSGDYTLSFDYAGSGFWALFNQDTTSFISNGPMVQFNGTGTESTILTLDGGSNYKLYFGAAGAGLPGMASSMSLDNVSVSAVPEPETYAMLMAGLGMLGFMSRRRQQR
jgi:hypothetical protein